MSKHESSLRYYSEDDFSSLFLEISRSADGAVIDYHTVVDRLHLHPFGTLDCEEDDHVGRSLRTKLLHIISNTKERINNFAKNGKGFELFQEATGQEDFVPFQLKISTRSGSWAKVANPTLARSMMLDCKKQVAGSLGRTDANIEFVAKRIPAPGNRLAQLILVNKMLAHRRARLQLEDDDLLEFIDAVIAGGQLQLAAPAA